MKLTYDLKSLALGLILGAGVVLALGAVRDEPLQVGRYRIVMNPNHAFILDTATGQASEKFLSSGSGQTDTDFGASRQSHAEAK